MKKMCVANLGLLLLALHLLSAQVVQAQNTSTTVIRNATIPNTTRAPNATSLNMTSHENGSGTTDAFTLLLPLALGASLLLGWS